MLSFNHTFESEQNCKIPSDINNDDIKINQFINACSNGNTQMANWSYNNKFDKISAINDDLINVYCNNNLEMAQQLHEIRSNIDTSVDYKYAFALALALALALAYIKGHSEVVKWLRQIKPDICCFDMYKYALIYSHKNP